MTSHQNKSALRAPTQVSRKSLILLLYRSLYRSPSEPVQEFAKSLISLDRRVCVCVSYYYVIGAAALGDAAAPVGISTRVGTPSPFPPTPHRQQ